MPQYSVCGGAGGDETRPATCWPQQKVDDEYVAVHYTSLSTDVHS